MTKRKFDSKTTQLATARRQKGFLSSRQGLVLLFLIFLTPTFVAWVMHNSGESGWQPEGLTNRGTLVHPARPLSLPAELRAGDVALNDYLQGKWTLLYIGDVDCDTACRTSLYNMRQVHTLQNEHMRRVQRLFLLNSDTLPEVLDSLLKQEYSSMAVTSFTGEQEKQIAPYFEIEGASMHSEDRVYIVDPLGNLMMYYPPGFDPGGMHKDLKKLLKYSKIG